MGVSFKIDNIALITFVAITLLISTLCHNSSMFPYTLHILLLDLYEVNSILIEIFTSISEMAEFKVHDQLTSRLFR